jgi:hypothetical protein
MLEPMLADFKEFVRSSSKSRGADLREKLQIKKNRLEQLLEEYTSGNYQTDVVERVRSSRIVKNERDIHANFSVGLLILGCALTRRLGQLRLAKGESDEALMIDDGRLWKLISIIQAGDIQLDISLAERCLSPLRVGEDKAPVQVPYPPIPTRLLHGISGVVFPIESAVAAAIDMATALIIENLLISTLGSGRDDTPEAQFRSREFLGFRSRGGRLSGVLSDLLESFLRVGVVPRRLDEDGIESFHYLERSVDELQHRIMRMFEDRPHLDGRNLEEIHHFLSDYFHRFGRRPSSYMLRDLMERLQYMIQRPPGR